MRTTVDIPDPLYRELKVLAAREGKTIKELVLQGVDGVIRTRKPAPVRRLKFPLIGSDTPGTLHLDNEKIYDLIGFP